jgi:hypothetical protein
MSSDLSEGLLSIFGSKSVSLLVGFVAIRLPIRDDDQFSISYQLREGITGVRM